MSWMVPRNKPVLNTVTTSCVAWTDCSSCAFRSTSASPTSETDSWLPTSQAARSDIACANSPAAAATSARCFATASIALTRPRSCVSRLSRYDFCLSNHCGRDLATCRYSRDAAHLIGFVEPRTRDRLTNGCHESALLLSNLGLPMFDLSEDTWVSVRLG